MERTLKTLTKLDGRVYVFLANDEAGKAFLAQAEAEGMLFGTGTNPTDNPYATVMAINHDGTLNYVGANGMIAFQAGADTVGGERLICVDYEKYASGETNFLIHQKREHLIN